MPNRRWQGSFPDVSTRRSFCVRPAAGRRMPRSSQSDSLRPRRARSWNCPYRRLVDVQGKIEAHEADLPLVIRKPLGLGQVVFVATDLDRGPIRDWTDRSLLLARGRTPPANWRLSSATDAVPAQSYGYNDLAGQLRSALDRATRRAPRAVLRGGPAGDRLHPLDRTGRLLPAPPPGPRHAVDVDHLSDDRRPLCRRRPTLAAYWLKGDQLRVSQVDLVDIDAEGTARGASWFSIFSPRGESFDLSMRPRLPDGQPPQQTSAVAGLVGQGGQRIQRHVWPRQAELGAALEPGLLDRFVAGRDPRRADPGLGFQEFRAALAGTRCRSGAGRIAQG